MKTNLSYNYDFKWETPIDDLMIGYTRFGFNDLDIQGIFENSILVSRGVTGFHEIGDLESFFLTIRYSLKHLVVMGELSQNDIRREIDVYGLGAGFLRTDDIKMMGWYLSVSYRFCSYFEAEYKYSEFYNDRDNKDGKGKYDANEFNEMIGVAGQRSKLKNAFEAWTKANTVSFRFDINTNGSSNWKLLIMTVLGSLHPHERMI